MKYVDLPSLVGGAPRAPRNRFTPHFAVFRFRAARGAAPTNTPRINIFPRRIYRECAYFRKHEEHMNYDRNQERGVPIGSGAMESQCSQNQNRFKRRGQFWSEDGFSAASKAYVRYTNDELKYCYRRKAA